MKEIVEGYSPLELADMYREAADKRKQLQIIADMMGTKDLDVVIEMLKGAGVDGRSLPRKSRNEASESKVEQPAPVSKDETIETLIARKNELMREMATIDNKLRSIRDAIDRALSIGVIDNGA